MGGEAIYQESQELKIKILDHSNKKIILEIQQSLDAMKELKNTMENLGVEHSKVTENLIERNYFQSFQSTVMAEIQNLKDPIPRNIKGILNLAAKYIKLNEWSLC